MYCIGILLVSLLVLVSSSMHLVLALVLALIYNSISINLVLLRS